MPNIEQENNQSEEKLNLLKAKIKTPLEKAQEKQIQLLQEYRTALISEAVTGKIKVS